VLAEKEMAHVFQVSQVSRPLSRSHDYTNFRRAKTSTPKPGSMTAVAASLNETQIEQVAAYLSVTAP
jgi:cytochrome c553